MNGRSINGVGALDLTVLCLTRSHSCGGLESRIWRRQSDRALDVKLRNASSIGTSVALEDAGASVCSSVGDLGNLTTSAFSRVFNELRRLPSDKLPSADGSFQFATYSRLVFTQPASTSPDIGLV